MILVFGGENMVFLDQLSGFLFLSILCLKISELRWFIHDSSLTVGSVDMLKH